MARRTLDAVGRRPAIHDHAPRRTSRLPTASRSPSDDVVFSLRAAYDRAAGSVLADSLKVGGKPLAVTAPDPRTVVVTFPAPFGPGLRLLDNLPILPKHKLEPALTERKVRRRRGASARRRRRGHRARARSCSREYAPGQRMVFTRNAEYFRQGRERHAAARTWIASSSRSSPTRTRSCCGSKRGQLDMHRRRRCGRRTTRRSSAPPTRDACSCSISASAFDADGLLDQPQAGRVRRRSARAVAPARRAAPGDLAGRRSQAFTDTVFLGAAVPVFGPITPAQQEVVSTDLPQTPHDPARAKALLASIGLTDRNGDGMLEDAAGQPARFALLTQKGQTAIERGAAVIRDELRKIGLPWTSSPLEGNALVQRFLSGDVRRGLLPVRRRRDTDPAINARLLVQLRRVARLEPRPDDAGDRVGAPDRRADGAADLDRGRRRAQAALRRGPAHLRRAPADVHFVAPRIYVAASTRVTNLTPRSQRPQLLWAADTIAVRR